MGLLQTFRKSAVGEFLFGPAPQPEQMPGMGPVFEAIDKFETNRKATRVNVKDTFGPVVDTLNANTPADSEGRTYRLIISGSPFIGKTLATPVRIGRLNDSEVETLENFDDGRDDDFKAGPVVKQHPVLKTFAFNAVVGDKGVPQTYLAADGKRPMSVESLVRGVQDFANRQAVVAASLAKPRIIPTEFRFIDP